jgi:hypothetical protein
MQRTVVLIPPNVAIPAHFFIGGSLRPFRAEGDPQVPSFLG